MKIIEINIVQFGKFKDASFRFDDGFNIVKGENESGKSTLLGFIKFALYGVGRKNPNVAVGERERAVSWNVGIAAGSLTVEDECGKRYRIERSGREGARGAYTDNCHIFDAESGEEVFSGEVPGEHFLGINAQAYDSMCNIKQLEAVAIGAAAVKGVIDNLLSSGDENMNVQQAIKTLDTERRRLLHTNGRGGLVWESENKLEKLRVEYKSALAFENECIKNLDELERVELSLQKAREEHALAQRICDFHDDVLRLEKFEQMRELSGEIKNVEKEIEMLDSTATFNTQAASFEQIANIKGAADTLRRSRAALIGAEAELEAAQEVAQSVVFSNPAGLSSLIDEFGSPKSALLHLTAKKKKSSNAAFLLAAFGVAGGIMLALAVAIAIAMNNLAGAATVAFIGALCCVVAGVSYKKLASAKAEINEFVTRVGDDFCPKDESKILMELEAFYNDMSARAQRSRTLEGAKIRHSLAEDTLAADLLRAREIISVVGANGGAETEEEELFAVAERMKDYLTRRASAEDTLREKSALSRSLKLELERFSESDIRARLTPEIIEKIKHVPLERIKSERDAALYRTNQVSQYKAGIERNIASSQHRRPSGEIFPEIETEQKHLDALKLRLGAVKLAMETINSASASLKSDITPRIRERAQKNIEIMTASKYKQLYIDDNMGLSVFADGATRPIDSLSKGSLDVAYFAVRLALVQTLLAEKNPPIYMDESLSQLDDKRGENTLRLIADYSKGAQSILFTCQTRDLTIASRVMEKLNLVELS